MVTLGHRAKLVHVRGESTHLLETIHNQRVLALLEDTCIQLAMEEASSMYLIGETCACAELVVSNEVKEESDVDVLETVY
jgi:hypothetical protein